MTNDLSHTHAAAYLTGVALGAAVLISALAPHLTSYAQASAGPVAVCVGRVSQAQAEGLASDVGQAETARAVALRGPSTYAAAKTGGPADLAALGKADAALAVARASYAAACAG